MVFYFTPIITSHNTADGSIIVPFLDTEMTNGASLVLSHQLIFNDYRNLPNFSKVKQFKANVQPTGTNVVTIATVNNGNVKQEDFTKKEEFVVQEIDIENVSIVPLNH